MLTPQNLTLNHPPFAPLFHSAPTEESRLFPSLTFLFREDLLAAPIDEDEKDDEDDPEDEDDLDEQEEEEDEDDYDDEEDDEEDDDRIADPGEEEDEEDYDDEEDEDEDDDEDDSSEQFFMQSSRFGSRGRLLR